jgi:hypothetical protein
MRLWVRKYGTPTARATITSPITRPPHAKPLIIRLLEEDPSERVGFPRWREINLSDAIAGNAAIQR